MNSSQIEYRDIRFCQTEDKDRVCRIKHQMSQEINFIRLSLDLIQELLKLDSTNKIKNGLESCEYLLKKIVANPENGMKFAQIYFLNFKNVFAKFKKYFDVSNVSRISELAMLDISIPIGITGQVKFHISNYIKCVSGDKNETRTLFHYLWAIYDFIYPSENVMNKINKIFTPEQEVKQSGLMGLLGSTGMANELIKGMLPEGMGNMDLSSMMTGDVQENIGFFSDKIGTLVSSPIVLNIISKLRSSLSEEDITGSISLVQDMFQDYENDMFSEHFDKLQEIDTKKKRELADMILGNEDFDESDSETKTSDIEGSLANMILGDNKIEEISENEELEKIEEISENEELEKIEEISENEEIPEN